MATISHAPTCDYMDLSETGNPSCLENIYSASNLHVRDPSILDFRSQSTFLTSTAASLSPYMLLKHSFGKKI
ncbi:hypothetical protein TMatcc_003413 [Talaromyces marneffei ATCC 18224]